MRMIFSTFSLTFLSFSSFNYLILVEKKKKVYLLIISETSDGDHVIYFKNSFEMNK